MKNFLLPFIALPIVSAGFLGLSSPAQAASPDIGVPNPVQVPPDSFIDFLNGTTDFTAQNNFTASPTVTLSFVNSAIGPGATSAGGAFAAFNVPGTPVKINSITIPLLGPTPIPPTFTVSSGQLVTTPPLVDIDLASLGEDTFIATDVTGPSFTQIGTGVSVQFSFTGVWTSGDPNPHPAYTGTFVFTSQFANTTPAALFARLTNPAIGKIDNSASFSASIAATSVPEPSAMAGLVLVAGSAVFLRRRSRAQIQ